MVLMLEDVSKAFDEKTLFSDLSLQVESGQRLGITGPNGTGKTTLLRLILNEMPPDVGEITVDVHAAIGYYAQGAPWPELRNDRARRGPGHAARFPRARGTLLPGPFPVHRRTTSSSPRAASPAASNPRLRLAKLILQSPNVLMLDEPTNHLDIPSREALEQALLDYPGTIVAVSHDRYFLDRIAGRLLVIRREGHTYVIGNYSEYIRQMEEAEAARQAAAEEERQAARNRSRPRARRVDRERSQFRRLTLAELEDYITERETRLRKLEATFADPAIYRDGTDVAALRTEFDTLKRELSEAEADWESRIAES